MKNVIRIVAIPISFSSLQKKMILFHDNTTLYLLQFTFIEPEKQRVLEESLLSTTKNRFGT